MRSLLQPMMIFGGSRNNGKTYELIDRFKADPDGILVLNTNAMLEAVQKVHGIDRDQLMTHASFLSGVYYYRQKIKNPNFYIDEAQELIVAMMKKIQGNGAIAAISLPASGPPTRGKTLQEMERIREQMPPTLFAQQYPVEFQFMDTSPQARQKGCICGNPAFPYQGCPIHCPD